MPQEGSREPAASLGLLDATMVGIGAMIGAGIFVLTGLAAEIAGPAALLVFALNGGVTTFTALSYAELASAIPKNGGGYAYIRETFSDPVAFVMGWTRWLTYTSAGALYALGFSSNFVEFVHLYWTGLPGGELAQLAYALLAVASFIALNALSTEASGGAETVVTLVKIGILGVFIIAGIGAVSPSTFMGVEAGAGFGLSEFFSRGAMNVLPAMGLTFIAFQGYDLIATVTEEVENPRKNIPRAIFISLGATVLIYLLVVGVALGTLGAPRLGAAGEKAVVEAAVSFMPDVALFGASIGAALIAFGAVFSTISALNAVVIGSSRIAFAMGREGQLPGRLGRIHHEYGTPFVALLASGAIMLVATVAAPIRLVGNLASLFSLLGFVVVNLAVIKLRRTQPDLSRPFEVPFYPIPPILGIALNLLLGVYISPSTWGVAAGVLAFGAAVYVALNPETVGLGEPTEDGPDEAANPDD
ncbi:amino acid permease [Halorubrum sp. BOL3-1]|uniref:APC family permease n=1 Tax=Halorubrum sp. BOL3-1 TaxID=2497325 RepID=UPI001005036B|nr:APC family permease [Halorubrum sp. BOL3-1]QAU11552.1 amino acid permease [Halorubrum sp. BOL3-1]